MRFRNQPGITACAIDTARRARRSRTVESILYHATRARSSQDARHAEAAGRRRKRTANLVHLHRRPRCSSVSAALGAHSIAARWRFAISESSRYRGMRDRPSETGVAKPHRRKTNHAARQVIARCRRRKRTADPVHLHRRPRRSSVSAALRYALDRSAIPPFDIQSCHLRLKSLTDFSSLLLLIWCMSLCKSRIYPVR